MAASRRTNRKEQILQSLAQMLETSPGQRITTAKLAAEVGVSEAALYRHFPSKARMFEGLIEFIEDTLLSRINLILENEKETQSRVYNILMLLLAFAEKNPGITRILTGDALQGENERLRERIQSLFEKLETHTPEITPSSYNPSLSMKLMWFMGPVFWVGVDHCVCFSFGIL